MKILLINPPAHNEITTQVSRYVTEASSMQPPLGLMYIAAVLLKEGFPDVEIIDSQAEKLSYEELEARLVETAPDMVGMTAMTFTMTDVMLTARLVKKANPRAKVVLGGPHVDIYPVETIGLKEVDFAIKGEGEYPFLELTRCLAAGDEEGLTKVAGLVWKDGDGEVRANESADGANDYSAMPFPARHLVPVDRYFSIMTDNNPITTLITAKGCPYQCVFCYKHVRKVSYRTPANVVDEMVHIKEMGIREIFFVDDTFYVNSKIAMQICDEINRRKVGIPWGARARVNNISADMLKAFKQAGCRRLHIGVESGNNTILTNLNKKIDVEMAKRAFDLCRKHKIDTLAYFIIGNPGEKEAEVEDTIRLAKELKPSFAQFSRMTPFPDTPLYRTALEKNIIPFDYWREYAKNPYTPVQPYFWTEHFSQQELADLADYATRRFYVCPSYILRSLAKMRKMSDFRRKAKTGKQLIFSRFHAGKKLKMV